MLTTDVMLGLSTTDATALLASNGPNEVPRPRAHPLLRFAAKFWGLSAWMIELIAALSLVLHKLADFWLAAALLVVNALIGFAQEQRAGKAVTALRSRLAVVARVLRDQTWQALPARLLVVGDVVRVRPGDLVPADIELVDGGLGVDQAALTGESGATEKLVGQVVYSGSTVRTGEAVGTVVATGARSYSGRTTRLVETAHPKLHVEEVIARVVRWMLVIVGVLVSITFVTALVQGQRLVDVLPISLVLLMSAVPMALPVMFAVSVAVGSMELGNHGVLITRPTAIEDAATMDVLCADKTGTLTMNQLALTGARPQPGFTAADVIEAGALASNAADVDPIDIAFLRAAPDPAGLERISFTPFSAATRCTEAVVRLAGVESRVVKGALRTVATAANVDAAALAALEAVADEQQGVRVLAVARADGDGPLRLCGLALLYDAPRPESRRLIDELRALGVEVEMLTGDAQPVAQAIATTLGLGKIARGIAANVRGGGFAEVFPEDKFRVVKQLQAAGHIVGMTGDGVNDAPALRQAEVGIAVSGATDIAKGAASAVLVTEGLTSIVELVKNGRATYQRVLTWLVNKVSRTVMKAGYVVIAFLVTGQFVMSALVMLLIVCLTDITHVTLATDNVAPSPKPETWNIGPLIRVAIAVGACNLVETLALLGISWHRLGLADDPARLQTFTFEMFLFFGLVSLVSMRERRAFWRSRPSTALAVSLAAAACVGVVIGVHGVAELAPMSWQITALVFGYATLCSLGPNDLVKRWLVARAVRIPAHHVQLAHPIGTT